MIQFSFHLEKFTFGQIAPKEKYRIDHRYKAFKKLKNFFKRSFLNFIKI